MKTINKFLSILLITASAGCVSCSDFLSEYSQDLAKVESWNDLDELLLGDGYLPPAMRSDNTGNLDILHFMTDEIEPNATKQGKRGVGYDMYTLDMFPFYTWMADTGIDEKHKYTGKDDVYWNYLYKRINICNIVIELIDEQPEKNFGDDIEKERVKGEAYFLRGAYYYLLSNLYGKPYNPQTADTDLGVPLKVSGTIEDIEYSRTPLSSCYKQIVSDLEKAETYLEGKTRKSIYRANQTAASLLLSRVYLYMQNWEKAAEYAEKVLSVQSSLLDLRQIAVGQDCLSKSSPETIFSMGGYTIAAAFADAEDSWFGDPIEASYYVSKEMKNLYGQDDLRASRYIGETEIWNYPDAFRKVSGQRSKYGSYCEVSSSFLMRTPEAYLNYAEAMAYAGNESAARQKLVTFLHTRMTADVNLDALSGNDLIDFIRDERAREFLLEGHRWFDLRRYTVCQPYPWSKTISHDYAFYGDYDLAYIERYVLEKFDAAYTLPIPRSVRNFQASIGNNPRPERTPNRVEPETDDDDDYDDWDW